MRYAFQISTFLLFLIPMALISVLYIQIAIALRRSDLERQRSRRLTGQPVKLRTHSSKAVFRMLGRDLLRDISKSTIYIVLCFCVLIFALLSFALFLFVLIFALVIDLDHSQDLRPTRCVQINRMW